MKYLFLFSFSLFCYSSIQSQTATETKRYPITIVIHGGAGYMVPENHSPEKQEAIKLSLARALKTGYEILDKGGSSLDAVEATLRVLEDDSLFNAGKGAVLTAKGKAELDASIMEGNGMKAGAVAGVTHIKNPISLARKVMDRTPHVLLTGSGAEEFAKTMNAEFVDTSYFIIPERLDDWKKAKEAEEKQRGMKGSGGMIEVETPFKFGTVGCVALDRNGNLAAGTSTGGMNMKMYGRVGDSPVIGAGTYANNKTCAVSCTGHGEYFIRYAVAHDISALMEYKGLTAKEAARIVVQEKLKAAGGEGGVIVLDRNGKFTFEFNTPGMYRGYMMEGKAAETFMFRD